jgi:hypothetical protein
MRDRPQGIGPFRVKTPQQQGDRGRVVDGAGELPQVGQKARLEPADERYRLGAPPSPVHSTSALSNSTQHRVRLPEWRWHMWQEQV